MAAQNGPGAAGSESTANFHVARNHAGREFVHGAIAAFCNISLTFPLNKVIARQAYEGLKFSAAFGSLLHEARFGKGWTTAMYRGVAPPLMQRTVSMGTMYGMYDFFYAQIHLAVTGRELEGDVLATDVPNVSPDVWVVKGAAAALSGCVEALLTPFERVQTLLQHRRYTNVYSNTWDAARAVSKHGYREFYRGFTGIVARNCPANALFFTLRDPARDALPSEPPPIFQLRFGGAEVPQAAPHEAQGQRKHKQHQLWSFTRDFVSGALLGSVISTVVYPIGTLKNVMQLEVGTPHKSLSQALALVKRERGGYRGLMMGARGNWARALISWGVTNSAYEVAKTYI